MRPGGGTFWAEFGQLLVVQSPVYAAFACAVVLAVVRRRLHPKASRLIVAGVAVIVLEASASLTYYAWVLSRFKVQSITSMPNSFESLMTSIQMRPGLLRFAQSLATAVGFALVFAATFVERTRPYDGTPP